MEINQTMIQIYEQLIDNISNQNNNQPSTSSSVEYILNNNGRDDQDSQDNEHGQDHQDPQDNEHEQDHQDHQDPQDNEYGQDGQHPQRNNRNNEDDAVTDDIVEIVNTQISNGSVLLKIHEIDTEIDFPWKIQGVISCKHPKRTYNNATGSGEITTWDIVDESDSINLVAFNLNSNVMSHRLTEGKAYEFNSLSIRSVDDAYKNLPHPFQLIVTNSTNVQEITMPFNYQLTYNFTHLNNIENLPLNSIIDIDVHVLRDYGTTVGNTNDNPWRRRELHVAQDGVQIKLTLWNEQAKKVQTSMVNMHIKLKNVKVSWYNGLRNLITLGNTHLSIV